MARNLNQTSNLRLRKTYTEIIELEASYGDHLTLKDSTAEEIVAFLLTQRSAKTITIVDVGQASLTYEID